ncbi:MAG: FAD-dependent oxidoreductase [Clostridia bacterium]|nr:FAD-dependent oxidoreductase [Clostridia bacterium]MDR3643477.1 FAD-dependent oxidoreductase [Clostridia bacterium]
MMGTDVLVVGGGPAGMAAALSAAQSGAGSVLIVERNERLGGILNQCIHNGFGLTLFGKELTGPEYAGRYADQIGQAEIPCLFNTTVVSMTGNKEVLIRNTDGERQIEAGAVILATGCRERPRGAISIPGSRPAGVYSAGTVQKLINCCGYMPGKRAVILGSGDIGLIMARRLTLEGAHVEAVCEIMPYSSGLKRNIVQCLEDYDIPLYLSHTVTRIFGRERVEGVEISGVDEHLAPVEGTQRFIECDTLLLSVGLIPENELAGYAGIVMDAKTGGPLVNDRLETSVPGIFACGNSLHVHDLADFASLEAVEAGKNAAAYVKAGGEACQEFECRAGNGIGSVVPQRMSAKALAEGATAYIRVGRPFENASIVIKRGDRVIRTVRSPRLTPGEMVKTVVRDSGDGDLTFEVDSHD